MDDKTQPTTVGAFDAKTHLSALLDRVEAGESITITRHGTPVARLVGAKSQVADPNLLARREEAWRRFDDLTKDTRLEGVCLKDLIDQGRRT